MATSAVSSGAVLRFGVFEVDLASGDLRKAGSRVKLQDQPRLVLLALLEHPGEVVTREALRQRLWPSDTFVDFDHGVNIAINKIRDAVNDSRSAPRFIETIPRRGYRFIAPVERIEERKDNQSPASRTQNVWARLNRIEVVAAGLVLAACAIAARMLVVAHPSRHDHVIAVMPLRNLSASADTDYFSDGLTDEIIYNLSIIDGLEVKSRTSSFQFKNTAISVRDAGRRLGSDFVLDGSVLQDTGRVRLDVALVRVADDVTLWSRHYDRATGDIFAIQDEISRDIVNELRLKGVGGRRQYRTDPTTYDLYLRGSSLAYESAPEFDGQLNLAVALLQQATNRDPEFAPAYAAAAEVYAHLRNRGRSQQSGERTRAAAERAVALDPLLPQAQATLGLVRASALRWDDAESAFRRALELDPSFAAARADFATYVLEPEGRLNEALAQLRQAVELDPLSRSRRVQLAFALLRAGKYENALAIAQTELEADPHDEFASQLAARALLFLRKPDEALAILETLGPPSHGYLGYVYAALGRRREAERVAAESDPAAARHQVLIYAALGERERCFEALQALAQADDPIADLYPGEPELASLRNDPQMRAFRRMRNLPAY